MRSNYLACVLLIAASGCEKKDPLFCKENPGATGCMRPDGDVTVADSDAIEVDGPPADAQQCFGTTQYSICLMAPPMGDVPLTGDLTTEDTNTACLADQPTSWSGAGQAEACIIVGATISVSNLNVTGNRPLVLVASDTVTVTGYVDVASRRLPASKTGPDSDPTDCPTFPTSPASSNNGAGGGAGGTFATDGGDGGRGGNAAGNEGTAAPAGGSPTKLRGGCDGQDGANGEGNGGPKGRGGGAIYIAAGIKIVFTSNSFINASGSSASKADESAGGGGGGSGGMIVLNAPMMMAGSGVALVANGGGGSSGGDNSNGCGGCQPGNDPNPLAPTTAAAGGSGGGGGGGAGAAGVSLAGPGIGTASAGVGGGGGGGGAGYIQVSTAITGVTASPAVNVVP